MEETLKHHHIKFKAIPVGTRAELEDMLAKIKGVQKAVVDIDKGDAFVEYDLDECTEEDIEDFMVDGGFMLDDSIMQRVKRGWIHYTEENEKDNLHHRPKSCCDVDEIERKRKDLK